MHASFSKHDEQKRLCEYLLEHFEKLDDIGVGRQPAQSLNLSEVVYLQ